MTHKTGECLCGAVTFTAVDMADHFSCCHCKTCQRWAGSAFKGVSVATENLTITGQEQGCRKSRTVLSAIGQASRRETSQPLLEFITTGPDTNARMH